MLARRMGLPLGGFVAASNVQRCRARVHPHGRLPPEAVGADSGQCDGYRRTEQFRTDAVALRRRSGDAARAELEGFRCDDASIRRTIDELYERHGYFSDPHSAVGYAASATVDKPGFYLSRRIPPSSEKVIESVTGSRGARFRSSSSG